MLIEIRITLSSTTFTLEKNFENPYKVIEWKLYGPLLEINRMDFGHP
jgi:hypothetical protein